jgi:hypothetical protein
MVLVFKLTWWPIREGYTSQPADTIAIVEDIYMGINGRRIKPNSGMDAHDNVHPPEQKSLPGDGSYNKEN